MMKIATPENANMGLYYEKVRGVARHRKRNTTAMGFDYKRSIEITLGTRVQRYNKQKGLTFNYGSRSKQKSLEDGGESGATNCGENRREPSSSAPGDPSGH